MLALVNAILRARHLLVRTALLFVTLSALITLSEPRRFTSESAVMAQGGRGASGLSGLAAQFGVSVPAGDASVTPAFVANLLSSPEMRRRLAQDTLVRDDGAAVPVASLYDVDGIANAEQTTRITKALGKDLRIATETETGLIRIRSTARNAEVASLLAIRLARHGDSVLVARRQRQSLAEASYVSEQLHIARRELARAEGALQAFMDANRRYTSPRLSLEAERLRRDVSSREALVGALNQSAEQSRLEAGRPTPVLNTIEPPPVPALPNPRGLVIRCLFALLGGLVLGVCIALFRESLQRQANEQQAQGEEFSRITRDLTGDLRRPWRLIAPGRKAA